MKALSRVLLLLAFIRYNHAEEEKKAHPPPAAGAAAAPPPPGHLPRLCLDFARFPNLSDETPKPGVNLINN